jgi:hypothetical protein
MAGQVIQLSGQTLFRMKDPGRDRFTLSVDVSQNLIIIPARVNHSRELKLVLDTGIVNTIITGLNNIDTLSLRAAQKIRVGGLGDGTPIEAYFSRNNHIDINHPEDHLQGITGENLDLYVMATDQFELSRQLGMLVNGLIGSDLFFRYVVGLDPVGKTVTFYERDRFDFRKRTRSYTRIPLTVKEGKAYLDIRMLQDDNTEIQTRLLIDTGASLPFWISTLADSAIVVPAKTVRALLGQGLNGIISGVNGRIKRAELGPFTFRKPLVSYPDSSSVAGLKLNSSRHGSIGMDILRRFSIYFDFRDSALYLRPNKWFRAPFLYNRSGMDIEKVNPSIPVYTLFSVIPGSPAGQAGLQPGDMIEYINYLPAFTLTLDEINNILYGESGRLVILRINRDGKEYRVRFRLEEKI